MLTKDEDALICDFAEYYHIYDWTSLEVQTVAILAQGLPSFSRIKMSITRQKVNLQDTLLAMIADSVNLLVWSKTSDARTGTGKPKSILKTLMEDEAEKKKIRGYDTVEEFEEALRRARAKKERKWLKDII